MLNLSTSTVEFNFLEAVLSSTKDSSPGVDRVKHVQVLQRHGFFEEFFVEAEGEGEENGNAVVNGQSAQQPCAKRR